MSRPWRPEFLDAVKMGDLLTVMRMLEVDPDLLFVDDEHYGSPVRAATDSPYPQMAEYLAGLELARLREGSILDSEWYGAIHDLGEAAHSETGYQGCESLRAAAEPVVAGFLSHDDPHLRYIAIHVLTLHWNLARYAEALLRMANEDPDEFVRQMALAGCCYVLLDTRDRRATTVALGIFRDLEQDRFMRQTAYEGVLEMWKGWETAHRFLMQAWEAEKPFDVTLSKAALEHGTVSAGERDQAARAMERVWEDLIDWDFITDLERQTS